MMGMHGEALGQQGHPGGRPAARPRHALRRPRHRQPRRPTRRNAKKIHIEIDPAEINKNVRVDVALVGDLREVLDELLPEVAADEHGDWLEHIGE